MKVALIHDSLGEFGGSERVLAELLNLFPQAKVFTSYYSKEILRKYFPNLNDNLCVSWFQKSPRKTTTTIQFLSPLIWRFKNLEKLDLTITSSAYYLSPIATLKTSSPTIHYIHSLPKNLFSLEKRSFWQKTLPFSYQKSLYLKSLRKSPNLITNSRHTKKMVKRIIGINSKVIYPPVSIPPAIPSSTNKKEYFLIVSRIEEGKNLEIAILACRHLNLPLKIAGFSNNPRYLKKLQKKGGKTVKFLGFVSEEERIKLYQKTTAFLFCSKNEDFGIAPVEAMAHGVPVIAYWGGGVKETIINGKTGVFFRHHSWQSMVEAIKKLDQMKFNRKTLYNQAKKFSRENFQKNVKAYLKRLHLKLDLEKL